MRALLLLFPEFCIFYEDIVGGKAGNAETRQSVAESLFDNIAFDKRYRRQDNQINQACAAISGL